MSEDLSKQRPRPHPPSFGKKKTTKTLLKSDSKESCFIVVIIMWIAPPPTPSKKIPWKGKKKKKKTDEKYIRDESTLVNAPKSLAGLLFVLLSGFKVNSLGTWKRERKKSKLNVDAQPVFWVFFCYVLPLLASLKTFIFALFEPFKPKRTLSDFFRWTFPLKKE